MTPFVEAYLERLTALHDDLKRAMAGLPAAATGWVPGPEMNSIAVLIVHLCGAERYWIGDVALQQPSDRVRAAEFKAGTMSVDQLRQRLDASLAYARQGLASLGDADLSLVRSAPAHQETFTVSWALLHALEHTATHVGHVQMTSDLWRGSTSGQ